MNDTSTNMVSDFIFVMGKYFVQHRFGPFRWTLHRVVIIVIRRFPRRSDVLPRPSGLTIGAGAVRAARAGSFTGLTAASFDILNHSFDIPIGGVRKIPIQVVLADNMWASRCRAPVHAATDIARGEICV